MEKKTILEVGKLFYTVRNEPIEIVGKECLFAPIFYDQYGAAYYEDGIPMCGDMQKRLIL